jgi:D-hexose-6-phosphate mutarotase
MTLAPSPEILRLWDCHFRLTYTVTLGTRLRMALTAENTGENLDVYTEALHTYFAVGDARSILVYGLENTEYVDKTLDHARNRQGGEPVVVRGEFDRVYVNTRAACILNDPVWGRTITVAKSGSQTTVVWNPHEDKAAALSDFGDDEWRRMICIETANAVDSAVSLSPGESHTIEAHVGLT